MVQERLNRLSKVVNILEESLTTKEAMIELQEKSVNTRFDYYKAFTKIMMNLLSYMERIHDIAADQAKFNSIKERMRELSESESSNSKEGKAQIVKSKEQADDLLELLREEMAVRSRQV